MVEMEPRRSARANKGVHTKRELEEYQVGGVEKTGSHKLSTKNEVKKDHEKVPTTVKKEKIKEEVKDKVFDSNDDNNSVENEDNEEVRCTPCGATTENYDEENDTLGDMILCDKCKTWQHIKCMGYRKNNVPKVYQCDICSGEPRPANVKQQQQQQQQKNKKKRAQQSETVLETDSAAKKQKTSSSTPEEKEPLEQEEIVTIESLKNPLRISTAKAFYNFFRKSYPSKQGDVEISVEEKEKKATQLALEVEDIIQREFPGKLYVSEGRRILFVLKKQFTDEVFAGTLTLEDVVKKTPEEINQDIARIEQKNRENIKNIILIENDQSQIVRRTHKGEIVKENENEEYDGGNIMDVSIDARPVDHRRFSEENTINSTSKTLQQSKGRQNAYNHTNPRFGDDFSSDDDAEEEQEEKQEEEGKENVELEVGEMEHGDEEGIDKDGILDGNQTKVSFVDGEEGELLERKKSHSSESLSDIETRSTSDDGKLEELLSGNDDFSQNYNSNNSNNSNSGNRKERFEPPEVWHGSITFPEYSHFKAVGKFYSSTDDEQDHYSLSKATAKDILKETNYVVRGRLERARCDKYLNEITATRNLYFVQIQPDDLASPTDATKYKRNYERLYNYFIKENKVGVLSGRPDFVKDSYIMPIDFRDVNLSSAIQAHKRDLRMGLFAVFVVQKHYIPQNVPSKATPPLSHPNPYIQLQPQQPPPQQSHQQQSQQQRQSHQHRYQQVQEFHQDRHQSSLPPPPSSLPAVPSSLPPIPSMQHGATLYNNDQESNGAEENLSSILDQLK